LRSIDTSSGKLHLPRDRFIDQDDIMQETYVRVLEALHGGRVLSAKGSQTQFSAGVRRRVIFETLRALKRSPSRASYAGSSYIDSPVELLIEKEERERAAQWHATARAHDVRLIDRCINRPEAGSLPLTPTERSQLSRLRKSLREWYS
jgi:DNA-directed RNA polymerase specialized sigma24 family protein